MNQEIIAIIDRALKEDIPTIDVSSEYLFYNETSLGKFIAKEEGIISGIDVCKETFLRVDPNTKFQIHKQNGDSVTPGQIIATVSGKTKSILKAERVGLNFMQRMSGIATLTHRFVKMVESTNTKILDTRKTTPTLRILEKRAVRDGGGTNHRMNLSEMVMLKDNHLNAAGSIKQAVEIVRKRVGSEMKIEVEVETFDQFQQAMETDADIIMLDNMSNELTKRCVDFNQGKKLLEASGNMTLDRVESVAKTGVDMISVGGLTHSYKSLDISLKF